MKSIQTRTFIAFVGMLIGWFVPNGLCAYVLDGIRYYLNSSSMTAEVISNNYTGAINIPASIIYNGSTYRVTGIDHAFDGCTGLTSLYIPSSLVYIDGVFPFADCTSLNSIIVDTNNPIFDSRDNCNAIIKTDTNTLLYGCQNTTIPNSVTSIGLGAFYHCTELTTVTIPNSVTEIQSLAFSGCSGLTSVIIPNGVTSIVSEIFTGCTSLVSVTIPNSVTSIGSETFAYCTGLTSVTIPSSVIEISSSAFNGCTGLNSLTVEGETPPSISSSTFDNVDKTNCTLYVPYGSKSAYQNANGWCEFQNIKAYFNAEGLDVLATGSCGSNATYTIYSDMTMVISGTGEMCHVSKYSQSIQKVIIEDGVTCFDDSHVFDDFTSMTSVFISSTMEDFAIFPFDDCAALNSIIVDPNNPKFDSRDNCNAIIETASNTLWWGCKNSTIPSGVTSISESAFSNCKGLATIEIPSSVTEIGGAAFSNCSGLTSVIIPGNVTAIKSETFANCTSLTSLSIPSSVTEISSSAFNGCTGLNSIKVESKMPITIDDGVFESVNKTNCTLYVPAGCKSAYENAEGWSEFQNIKESPVLVGTLYYHLNISERTAIVEEIAIKGYSGALTIPESINYDGNTYFVVEIGNHAFSDCTGLTSVNLPNSLKFINERAFYHCTGLTSLTIPNGVTNIARHAFGECTGLTSLTIPSSVIEIGTFAFKRCENLNSITVESEFPFDLLDGQFSEVDKETCVLYVPIGCKSAYKRTYGWSAFENIVENTSDLEVLATGICGVGYTIYSNLTMVISGNGEIWDALTSYHATGTLDYFNEFYNDRQNVLKIIIEDGVTGIGEEALFGSHSMTSLTIPPSMTYIGKNAFSDCFHLTSVYISDLTAWCNLTFDGSGSNPISYAHHLYLNGVQIKDLVIPDNVSSVKSRVFSGCTDLTSLTIPNSVTSIGDWAFCCCTGLTSVVIPSSVATIGEGAFSRCSDLASISIPSSVTTIGGEAFSDTPWYDNQPDGLIYINHLAYKYKGEMPTGTEIAINSGTVSISGYAFSGCTGLTSIEIPTSVTSIGDYAFSGCTGLTSVDIPSSVTSIGNSAFSYCRGLTSLEIPKSVTAIDEYAFYDCSKLTSIAVERETPPSVECSTFDCVNKTTCILYVPFGSKSAYENADYWNEFENIVEVEFDTDISTLDNAIYVDHIEGRIGGTMDIPIKVKSTAPIDDFKFKMILPAGTTVNSWALSSNRLPSGATVEDHFSEQNIVGNTITLACMLNYNAATFTGNDGEIATVNVTFGENMEVGTYPIRLTGCNIGHIDLSDVKATLNLEDYVVGDANGDGRVRIGDASAILHYIVGYPSADFQEKAADVNGDGLIRIGDVSAVLKIIVGL